MMKILLSLPSNAAKNAGSLLSERKGSFFCTSDPVDKRLGSGGGSTWLLEECLRMEKWDGAFEDWLPKEKRILIHAGGQSRRLPAYAVTGKLSLPVPVFRWSRGQRLDQDLLSLQLPLYEKIMKKAPDSLGTLVASGDVLIQADVVVGDIPEADVVCFGLWVDASLATRHGVFMARRESPDVLDRVMQKPSLQTLEELSHSHLFLMDIGLWLLSDRAVNLLRARSTGNDGETDFYDLYGDFGLSLGMNPMNRDEVINGLSVRVLPLDGGSFFHYGTSREMISSTLAMQHRVHDQRLIMHRKIKPNPAIFIQNTIVHALIAEENRNIWIENSFVGRGWRLASDHLITGVPENDWRMDLPKGVCIDMVPLDEGGFAIRPYGLDDVFKGAIDSPHTLWMGKPFHVWLTDRGIDAALLDGRADDIQSCGIFPCLRSLPEMERVLLWMMGIAIDDGEDAKRIWMDAARLSADELMERASVPRLLAQRENLRRRNYIMLERNFEKSVFYQLDLAHVAKEYVRLDLPVPEGLPLGSDKMKRIHNCMLRSKIFSLQNNMEKASMEKEVAFDWLRKGMMEEMGHSKQTPSWNSLPDQIIWGRSPVRMDLAGGWTDTPPYSIYSGGNVVNVAIELNDQPPLQVYVKPCLKPMIVLRSIDMGATEVVDSFEGLRDFRKLGSPFSIPKAALALCGFLPEFASENWGSLREQLLSFGTGLEITLLSTIPAGSGLGTSSILAATVLGTLSDFCGLHWGREEICGNTLILEQLLTSGGGWQDQYGGVFHGIKLLQSVKGFVQKPGINWLPEYLFSDPEYRTCHLLYYTGITRVAKNILGEIVQNVFLNSAEHLAILDEMKMHTLDMARGIQRGNFEEYGKMVSTTWEQKRRLDRGTNPPEIERMTEMIKDYTLGYILPGAGGGGYLYMVAKDVDAANRIRHILNNNRPNNRARFVNMKISGNGLQISRS